MQSANGGWGAFDKDNTRRLVNEIPFCDFGEVIDPPSEDVTAHVIEALAPARRRATRAAVRRGLRLPAPRAAAGRQLVRALGRELRLRHRRRPARVPGRRRATCRGPASSAPSAGSRDHQNADGGWGETCASYDDPALAGAGRVTASQTAWGLIGAAAPRTATADGEAVERGVRWLVERQEEDGQWEEPQFTGTGFPGDFYIKYHLYRNYWPLTALGRYRALRAQA